ncbi:hypothetical protein F8388_006133 [Cannabis sativa]|uniref:Copine C-terminal domain-containing protein n=1 Tax=Cannabis sativa TaxID=3483 RepID=A0A7J6G7A6_CANSA|nr:hypothetical protein F8388_006133 [Cannabis sativa]
MNKQCQSFGKTLSAFDEDNLIPCYGFGDVNLCDCFPPYLAAGTTSFVPEIEMHMTIVEQSHGQYHVLLIIADGQVTRSVDTRNGKLSSQEQKTIDAIVKARCTIHRLFQCNCHISKPCGSSTASSSTSRRSHSATVSLSNLGTKIGISIAILVGSSSQLVSYLDSSFSSSCTSSSSSDGRSGASSCSL